MTDLTKEARARAVEKYQPAFHPILDQGVVGTTEFVQSVYVTGYLDGAERRLEAKLGDQPIELWEALLFLIPSMERPSDEKVETWPEDEQKIFRDGFPELWRDFTQRAAALDLHRRTKLAKKIATFLGEKPSD